MPTRTISASGGNYNATSSWVEGVVPTLADDVIGLSSSGNLTVNVISLAGSLDLSEYLATLTFNSDLTVDGGSQFSATMSFAGTGKLIQRVTSVNTSPKIIQAGTQNIPYLELLSTINPAGAAMFVGTNYVNNFGYQPSNNQRVEGGTINIAGSYFGSTTVMMTGNATFSFNGSGTILGRFADTSGVGPATNPKIVINGSYSTPAGHQSVSIGNNVSITTTTSSNSRLTFYFPDNASQGNTFSCARTIGNVIFDNNLANNTRTIRISDNFIANNIIIRNPSYNQGTSTASYTYNFTGGGVSASNFYCLPNFGNVSGTGLFLISPTIVLDNNFTHSITNLVMIGAGPTYLFRGSTTSSKANLIVNGSNAVYNANFRDIDADLGGKIYNQSGTFSNSDNIFTTIVGGGGQFGFASIN